MEEIVITKNGWSIEMQLIKTYPNGKLFFAQERICTTDLNNNEMTSTDIVDLVEEIM